ncbi:SRPBCC family protein [Jiulongibacter sp. NS-SX5]|uniref:SRPBCC family protein n=1 Tax=Jiulongibacter sp. NS-SX5 TaxID=3463854 RepID=UPI0040590D26
MQKIKIEAEVKAPVAKVWEYWNGPEHIVNWNFASDDWCCPSASVDLKPGGKYSARMEAKDGSFGFDFNTVYDEVLVNERIQYTMEDGRVAVTTFEANGDQTKVTTLFDPEQENPVEMQQQGWQAILNNFKKYSEKN